PGVDGRLMDNGPRLVEPGAGRGLRDPAVGQPSDPLEAPLVSAGPDPDRDGALDRKRCHARAGDAVVATLEGHDRVGPQEPQDLDLLIHAPAAVGERFTE